MSRTKGAKGKLRKDVDFIRAFYTATKQELFEMAKDAFRQRGVPEGLLFEAIYRCSLKFKADRKANNKILSSEKKAPSVSGSVTLDEGT